MAPPPNAPPPTLALTNALMTKLKPAKIFKNAVEPASTPPAGNYPQRSANAGPRHITGISFDDRGDQVITAGEDETFRLYSCKTGKPIKTLHSKKYGVDLPRFTHRNSAVVYASTKEDDTVRYHSLHDNKYLQYFKGHKGRVISLEVAPIDDGFMSGSMDKTVRLWDLRAPTCRGLLTLPSYPIIAYDYTGIVFAVAVNHYSRILLSYAVAHQLSPRPIYMTSLSFSSNGKFLLVGCSGDAHYIMDAFEGHLLAKLEGHVGLERRSMSAPPSIEPSKGSSGEEVSWTPDSKYVVGGSLDGKVLVWDVQGLQSKTGPIDLKAHPLRIQPLVALDGHPGPSRCVKFNPRLAMLCSAGSELAFWLPDMSGDPEEIARGLLKGTRPT
ncbi:putative WD40 repeat-like protein [Lyophyllum shimeji]|uniref:WD40 repeat-like protein n=1 Tax=Lyophyllum shimeji TaxID=47721 RepID=A0A9P3PS09_LYOSH|nr:putative WD40 repeat-like protein [Lyophyllum shimeji]